MAAKQTLSKGLKREFEVIITNGEIENLVDLKLESIAKEANLPGFRPGKVPVSVVKNRFGKQVLGEVVRETVDTATKEAMENHNLTSIFCNNPDIGHIKAIPKSRLVRFLDFLFL